jgi:predicted transcriptional regulator
MNAVAEKIPSGITSVKLGKQRKDTLATLAQRKQRTVHSLVIEAVDLYTKEQTAWAEFEDQAIRSYENFQATGLHTTQAEMREWAKSLKTNPNAPMPLCHT